MLCRCSGLVAPGWWSRQDLEKVGVAASGTGDTWPTCIGRATGKSNEDHPGAICRMHVSTAVPCHMQVPAQQRGCQVATTSQAATLLHITAYCLPQLRRGSLRGQPASVAGGEESQGMALFAM